MKKSLVVFCVLCASVVVVIGLSASGALAHAQTTSGGTVLLSGMTHQNFNGTLEPSGNTSGQSASASATTLAGGTCPPPPPSGGAHPNLFLNQSEINQLKTMITQKGYVQNDWNTVKSLADAAVHSTSNYTDILTNNMGGSSWYAAFDGQPISALGMAYQLTGSMSYANKGAQVLRSWMATAPCSVASPCNFYDLHKYTIVSIAFLYDMICNSGALSATDINNLNAWFEGQVWRADTGWTASWLPYRNVSRLYEALEGQDLFLYDIIVGYLVGDQSAASYGISGDGTPYTWGALSTPTRSSDPYSFYHMLHDIGYPDGSSIREAAREGTWGYIDSILYNGELAALAAYHNGIDLWHYRDPGTGFGLPDMLNFQARFVTTDECCYYGRNHHYDARPLFELMHSFFQDSMSTYMVNYSGSLAENISERDPTFDPYNNWSNAFDWDDDILGRVLPMIAAINRSNPNSTPSQPGSITSIPYEVSSNSIGFKVTAPSSVSRNTPFTVTVTAINKSDGSTNTGFTSSNVILWSANWSPAYAQWTGRGTCTYGPAASPTCLTVWNPSMDMAIPHLIFAAADNGVKTVTVSLPQGGVGESWRLEALSNPPANYPYSDVGSSPVRGFSNPIFVRQIKEGTPYIGRTGKLRRVPR